MSQQDNFLSPEIAETIVNVRSRFAEWFALIEKCTHVGLAIAHKMAAKVDGNQKLLETAIFLRVLQSLQAIVVLAERGMAADARTLLRSAAESTICQLKMADDSAFDQRLIENHDHYQQKAAKSLLSDAGALSQLTPEQQRALRQTLAEISARYPTKEPRKLNTASDAAAADAMALYITIFRPTSNDAAHTSIESLGRHFFEAEDGRHKFRIGPQLDDMDSTLGGAANVYLFALMCAAQSFGLPEHEAEVMAFHEEFKRIAKLGDRGEGAAEK